MVATLAFWHTHLSPPRELPFMPKVGSFTCIGPHGHPSLFDLAKTDFGGRKLLLSVKWYRPLRYASIGCTASSNSNHGSICINDFGALLSFFQEMGVNEKETEAVLDKNPDVRLLSLESIRCRIHLLQSVGLNGLALSRLITKRPDMLTAQEVNSLIHFLHDDLGNEVEAEQVERLLIGTEPTFLMHFDAKVSLLLDHGIPKKKIVHVLNNANLSKAICLKSVEEIQRTISFLNRFGAVEIIVKRPPTLNYDLDSQLIPRIGFLRDLSGGDEEGTGGVLRRMPAILSYTVKHMEDHVEFLRSFVGLTNEEIFRIILVFPSIMSASRERKLRPRINFLKQCGLDAEDIYRFLTKSPLFLGLSFKGNLCHKLSLLVKIGYVHRTKDMVMAIGAVTRTSCENLQKVIGLFLSYGFCSDDIVAMSRKHPQILQYNPNSLEEKMEYLIEEMGREVGELLSFPAFLGYNLDNRIKHRYEVKKKIIGEDMSINKLLAVSTERFSRTKKRLAQASSFLDGGNTTMS
ncbi:hypothetical protein Ancab_008978 [Ancistrocladus abbreviatus]